MRSLVPVGSLVLVVLSTTGAGAQDAPLNIDPSGVPVGATDPSAYPAPATSPATSQTTGTAGQPVTEQGEQFYIYQDGEGEEYEDQQPGFVGQVPELHVVRKGDTLWDLCGYYFSDPWRWPKVWAHNPTITNPHWIYPGDVVRLGAEGQIGQPAGPEIDRVDTSPRVVDDAPGTHGIELRQLSFLRPDEIKVAGSIAGSVEDKLMLTDGDEIFIEYPDGTPPQIGKRYAIYTPSKTVRHPETGDTVGQYVLLRGEVQIVEVKKDKKARGIITYVTGTIERGYKVGPVKTQFKDVASSVATNNLEGVIVGVIDVDTLIGEGMVVFLDRGTGHGLKAGNRMVIVRRGDAYDPTHRMEEGGRDDRRYPEETIGEILVIEVAKDASVALVVSSLQEALVGDHVVMRKGR